MLFKKPSVSLAIAATLFSFGVSADSSLNLKENYYFTSSANQVNLNLKAQKQTHNVNFHQGTIAKPQLNLLKSGQSLDQAYADYYLSRLLPTVITPTIAKQKKSAEGATLKMMHSNGKGAIVAKYQQIIDGKEVIGREFNVLMNDKHELIASSGYFSAPNLKLSAKNKQIILQANDAFQLALKDLLGANIFAVVQPTNKIQNYQHFEVSQTSNDFRLDKEARSKDVWFDSYGQLHTAYYLEFFGKDKDNQQFAYSYVVDAESGKILARKNLVQYENFTYRVFTADPTKAPILEGPQGHEYPIIGADPTTVNNNHNRVYQAASHQLVTLESAPFSRNDPWLAAGATTTSGNNVDAYLDISGEQGFNSSDFRAATTSANTFDYTYNVDNAGATNSQNSAIVNLFYMNNWLHDWMYDSGFDEASLNAQNDNFGRGGAGNDAINAEGQDFSGRNNANMATPSDGFSPRMQMYLYDGPATQGVDYQLTLTGVSGLTNPNVGLASYGPLSYPSTTGELVAFTDATAPEFDACTAPTNGAALSGKIALVDRGECNFTEKVKHSQDAGAIAVIVANNVDATAVITMGGDDNTITIPSMMVSQNDGATIRSAMDSGTVSATLFRNNTDVDGTLDNAIVAHEWGHYITNRLVGNAFGLINNQGRGMGEGWGDFMALLTYAAEADKNVTGNDQYQALYPMYGWADSNTYYGIRRVPYTTNMAQNGLTFKHIEEGVALPNHPVQFGANGDGNSAVHATGTVWATMLWEVYASLLNTYAFDTAQTKMKDYLVASLKMTPVAPTFVEARDAMLSVALATNATDYDLMLTAFAKRGIGVGAEAPAKDSDNNSGVVESFVARQSRYDFSGSNIDNSFAGGLGFCTDDGILDAGETALLTVSVKNTGSEALSNVSVRMASNADVSFSNNGLQQIASLTHFESKDVTFEVTLNSAQSAEDITLNVEFPEAVVGDVIVEPGTEVLSYKVNFDFGPDASRQVEDFSVIEAVENDWTRESGPMTIGDANQVGIDTAKVITTVENRADLGNALMFVDNDFRSDISFVSPELDIGNDPFSIAFEHFYDFEDGSWDGAVVEISVAGGAWEDVTTANGTFGTGYNGTIAQNNDSPISERSAFVNTSTDYINETLSFGTAHAGKTVRLRFRQGTDANTGGFGWIIDNIQFNGVTNAFLSGIVANAVACNSESPIVNLAQTSVDVRENVAVTLDASASTDPQGDSLSYSWVQLSGTSVSITDSNQAVASINSPDVAANEALVFEVTVSDGTNESKGQVTVNVEANVAPNAQVAQATITVNEGAAVNLNASNSSDANGDSLTYSWVQTSGGAVTLNNASTSSASFTAPQVTATTSYAFEVTVSDGELEDKAIVTVNVNNTTPPPEPPASGGGGGSTGILALLGLSLLAISRRRRKH